MTERDRVYLARVERDITGDVHLHVVRDTDRVELHEGDEFVTIQTTVDLHDPEVAS